MTAAGLSGALRSPRGRGAFYARVCDVSLTLRARACNAPRGHGTGHLRRDVCRNAIMCICALWRPPCTAAVCKVLPLWRGGAQRLDVRGSIPLSCLEDLSSDGDGFDPPPVQSKGMSFTPADRDGSGGETRLYPHSSMWLEPRITADRVMRRIDQICYLQVSR